MYWKGDDLPDSMLLVSTELWCTESQVVTGIVTVGVLERPFFLPVRPQTQPLELTVNQTLLCPLLEEYTANVPR